MFHGSLVALVTPMREDGSLDYDALARLIEFHIENGTDGIVAVGTTGEAATLSHKEHCDVVRHAVEFAGGRIPVIAGTGANSTREAIGLTRCAMEVGADACLLITPYYNKPTQEGLYLHFKAVAEAVPIPQILYNVPSRTAIDMLPETVARLAEISNIVGLKEATGKTERALEILERCGTRIDLFGGEDVAGMDLMLCGGRGVISVTSNVAPRAMHEMCEAAVAGDRERADAINAKLLGLHEKLFIESNPIPVKWALHEMGLIARGIRLPLTWLDDAYHDQVRQALRQAEVL